MGKTSGKAGKVTQPNGDGARLDRELAAVLTQVEAEKSPDELLRLAQELQTRLDRRRRSD